MVKDGRDRSCYQQLFVAESFPRLLSDGQTSEFTAAAGAVSNRDHQGRADRAAATPFYLFSTTS